MVVSQQPVHSEKEIVDFATVRTIEDLMQYLNALIPSAESYSTLEEDECTYDKIFNEISEKFGQQGLELLQEHSMLVLYGSI